MTVAVYRALALTLHEHGYESVLVGDEGGFGPKLRGNEQALELLVAAFARAGYEPGVDVGIGIDVAASHFFKDGRYHLHEQILDAAGMVRLLSEWVEEYPIFSIEDGLAEDDWKGWKKLTEALGNRVQLIGDDLFATNPERYTARHRGGRCEQRADQGKPDRHLDRDFGGDGASTRGGLPHGRLSPQRRD